MAWKEVLIMEERASFVLLAERKEQPIVTLCKDFGISRPTGYKWVARYRKYGLSSLKELSRRPLSCPHKTPKDIEKLVLRERRAHPTWGPKKLRDVLLKKHEVADPPAESTIGAILKRHGVPLRKRRLRGVFRLAPFELTIPKEINEVWTVDFKGWFF